MLRVCNRCGKRPEESQNFCPQCGAPAGVSDGALRTASSLRWLLFLVIGLWSWPPPSLWASSIAGIGRNGKPSAATSTNGSNTWLNRTSNRQVIPYQTRRGAPTRRNYSNNWFNKKTKAPQACAPLRAAKRRTQWMIYLPCSSSWGGRLCRRRLRSRHGGRCPPRSFRLRRAESPFALASRS